MGCNMLGPAIDCGGHGAFGLLHQHPGGGAHGRERSDAPGGPGRGLCSRPRWRDAPFSFPPPSSRTVCLHELKFQLESASLHLLGCSLIELQEGGRTRGRRRGEGPGGVHGGEGSRAVLLRRDTSRAPGRHHAGAAPLPPSAPPPLPRGGSPPRPRTSASPRSAARAWDLAGRRRARDGPELGPGGTSSMC